VCILSNRLATYYVPNVCEENKWLFIYYFIRVQCCIQSFVSSYQCRSWSTICDYLFIYLLVEGSFLNYYNMYCTILKICITWSLRHVRSDIPNYWYVFSHWFSWANCRLYTIQYTHRYLMTRLSLQFVYLWRHVSSTAPSFILWWSNLDILFGPLHLSSPFIGELRCQAIQMEHGPYIAERTQNAVYIVRCLWVYCNSLLIFKCLYWKKS
jgi:hypothetical protein